MDEATRRMARALMRTRSVQLATRATSVVKPIPREDTVRHQPQHAMRR